MIAGSLVDAITRTAEAGFILLAITLAIAVLICVAGPLLDRPLDAACRWTEALYQKKAKR